MHVDSNLQEKMEETKNIIIKINANPIRFQQIDNDLFKLLLCYLILEKSFYRSIEIDRILNKADFQLHAKKKQPDLDVSNEIGLFKNSICTFITSQNKNSSHKCTDGSVLHDRVC